MNGFHFSVFHWCVNTVSLTQWLVTLCKTPNCQTHDSCKGNIVKLLCTPNQRGGGAYCFWFLSALYHLNQWVDFDQTCTDTLLAGGKKWLDFGDLDLIFKVTPALWNFQILTNKSLSAPHLLNQMTDSGQTSYIVTLGWYKDLIRFWWPWPNFQGHHTIKTVKMSLVCSLSPEPIGGLVGT